MDNNNPIEYDILNGKKYKRLLLAYIDHIREIEGIDFLDEDYVYSTGLSEADAIDLTIIQQLD